MPGDIKHKVKASAVPKARPSVVINSTAARDDPQKHSQPTYHRTNPTAKGHSTLNPITTAEQHNEGRAVPSPPHSPSPEPGTSQMLFEAIEIVNEHEDKYKIRWAGRDPATGAPWQPSWEPKAYANRALVESWKEKLEEKERRLRKRALAAARSRERVQGPGKRSNTSASGLASSRTSARASAADLQPPVSAAGPSEEACSSEAGASALSSVSKNPRKRPLPQDDKDHSGDQTDYSNPPAETSFQQRAAKQHKGAHKFFNAPARALLNGTSHGRFRHIDPLSTPVAFASTGKQAPVRVHSKKEGDPQAHPSPSMLPLCESRGKENSASNQSRKTVIPDSQEDMDMHPPLVRAEGDHVGAENPALLSTLLRSQEEEKAKLKEQSISPAAPEAFVASVMKKTTGDGQTRMDIRRTGGREEKLSVGSEIDDDDQIGEFSSPNLPERLSRQRYHATYRLDDRAIVPTTTDLGTRKPDSGPPQSPLRLELVTSAENREASYRQSTPFRKPLAGERSRKPGSLGREDSEVVDKMFNEFIITDGNVMRAGSCDAPEDKNIGGSVDLEQVEEEAKARQGSGPLRGGPKLDEHLLHAQNLDERPSSSVPPSGVLLIPKAAAQSTSPILETSASLQIDTVKNTYDAVGESERAGHENDLNVRTRKTRPHRNDTSIPSKDGSRGRNPGGDIHAEGTNVDDCRNPSILVPDSDSQEQLYLQKAVPNPTELGSSPAQPPSTRFSQSNTTYTSSQHVSSSQPRITQEELAFLGQPEGRERLLREIELSSAVPAEIRQEAQTFVRDPKAYMAEKRQGALFKDKQYFVILEHQTDGCVLLGMEGFRPPRYVVAFMSWEEYEQCGLDDSQLNASQYQTQKHSAPEPQYCCTSEADSSAAKCTADREVQAVSNRVAAAAQTDRTLPLDFADREELVRAREGLDVLQGAHTRLQSLYNSALDHIADKETQQIDLESVRDERDKAHGQIAKLQQLLRAKDDDFGYVSMQSNETTIQLNTFREAYAESQSELAKVTERFHSGLDQTRLTYQAMLEQKNSELAGLRRELKVAQEAMLRGESVRDLAARCEKEVKRAAALEIERNAEEARANAAEQARFEFFQQAEEAQDRLRQLQKLHQETKEVAAEQLAAAESREDRLKTAFKEAKDAQIKANFSEHRLRAKLEKLKAKLLAARAGEASTDGDSSGSSSEDDSAPRIVKRLTSNTPERPSPRFDSNARSPPISSSIPADSAPSGLGPSNLNRPPLVGPDLVADQPSSSIPYPSKSSWDPRLLSSQQIDVSSDNPIPGAIAPASGSGASVSPSFDPILYNSSLESSLPGEDEVVYPCKWQAGDGYCPELCVTKEALERHIIVKHIPPP